MHRTPSALLIAGLALLLAAGCSTAVPGRATSDAAVPAPGPGAGGGNATSPDGGVAWSDEVCAAMLDASTLLATQPDPDITDPEGTIGRYSEYLGATVSALDTTIADLGSIGPGPLQGGGALIDALSTGMSDIRDRYQEAKVAVDGIDPASPGALTEQMPAALALTADEGSGPPIDLRATPELNAAAEAAPHCRSMGG